MPSYDLLALKAELQTYLEGIGAEPQIRKCGAELVARCPLHEDGRPSLVAVIKGGVWTWFCHPCGEGGSVLDLEMKRTGVLFGSAVKAVAQIVGIPPIPSTVPSLQSSPTARFSPSNSGAAGITPAHSRPKLPKVEPLEGDAETEAVAACRRLATNATLREGWSSELGVQAGTLAALAKTHDLGVVEDGRLCYVSRTEAEFCGLQVRNPYGREPRFLWLHGKPFLPWRGWRLLDVRVRTIYLCEGQSDAISLIDAGVENPEAARADTVVVAVPGTSFPDHWRLHFRCRHVVLCGDADAAGEKATARIGEMLLPVAESVRVFNWAAITQSTSGDAPVKDLRALNQKLRSENE